MPVAPRLFNTRFTVAANSTGFAAVTLDDLWLQNIRIVIPDGHAGLTGLQILQSGVVVFPFGDDPFIRGNNEVIDFEWDNEVTAAGLSVSGFNTDVWAHEWLIRWTITDMPAKGTPVTIVSPQAAAIAPADIADVLTLTGATA